MFAQEDSLFKWEFNVCCLQCNRIFDLIERLTVQHRIGSIHSDRFGSVIVNYTQHSTFTIRMLSVFTHQIVCNPVQQQQQQQQLHFRSNANAIQICFSTLCITNIIIKTLLFVYFSCATLFLLLPHCYFHSTAFCGIHNSKWFQSWLKWILLLHLITLRSNSHLQNPLRQPSIIYYHSKYLNVKSIS